MHTADVKQMLESSWFSRGCAFKLNLVSLGFGVIVTLSNYNFKMYFVIDLKFLHSYSSRIKEMSLNCFSKV